MLSVGFGTVGLRTTWADDALRYTTVMSKNKRLCTHVREVLNDDLINYGQGYDERKFQASIFSSIDWTPINGLDEGFDYGGSVAHVDINNDGTTDVVVRQETSGGKDITLHRLFIFKNDEYPELAKKRRELEDNSVGLVVPDVNKMYEFRGLPQKTIKEPGVLQGKKYYQGLSDAIYIHAFQFDSVRYLLITTSPDSKFVTNWALVAKYKQGKVREANQALMEDLCYLRLK